MAFLTEDTSILSKNVGHGGAGVYMPAAYEYGVRPAILSGGRRKTSRKSSRKTRAKKAYRRTRSRR